MAYWLLKTEPNSYSIDDLAREKTTLWDGVRNYQARNFLKSMTRGDLVLIYHSVVEPIGVVGLAKVAKVAYADPSQFESSGEYFDPKASIENPRWFCPDIQFIEKFSEPITPKTLRGDPRFKNMELLKRGSRLSVQPVHENEYKAIMLLKLARTKKNQK